MSDHRVKTLESELKRCEKKVLQIKAKMIEFEVMNAFSEMIGSPIYHEINQKIESTNFKIKIENLSTFRYNLEIEFVSQAKMEIFLIHSNISGIEYGIEWKFNGKYSGPECMGCRVIDLLIKIVKDLNLIQEYVYFLSYFIDKITSIIGSFIYQLVKENDEINPNDFMTKNQDHLFNCHICAMCFINF